MGTKFLGSGGTWASLRNAKRMPDRKSRHQKTPRDDAESITEVEANAQGTRDKENDAATRDEHGTGLSVETGRKGKRAGE